MYLDPATRLPCLEPEDGALEAFKQCCAGCGLQLRMLSSLPTCSTVDSDPMVLLAIGPGRAALELLPGAASAPLGYGAAAAGSVAGWQVDLIQLDACWCSIRLYHCRWLWL